MTNNATPRRLRVVLKSVSDHIHAHTNRDNHLARGLSREGYMGGYEQAIRDVLAAQAGAIPATRGVWSVLEEKGTS